MADPFQDVDAGGEAFIQAVGDGSKPAPSPKGQAG